VRRRQGTITARGWDDVGGAMGPRREERRKMGRDDDLRVHLGDDLKVLEGLQAVTHDEHAPLFDAPT
jgi:hypothetical protein